MNFTGKIFAENVQEEVPIAIESQPNKSKVMRTTLSITFQNGRWRSWWLDSDKFNQENYAEPWMHFYKWYFGRAQSQYYVMKFAGGQEMMKRDDIVSFSILIKEVEVNHK